MTVVGLLAVVREILHNTHILKTNQIWAGVFSPSSDFLHKSDLRAKLCQAFYWFHRI